MFRDRNTPSTTKWLNSKSKGLFPNAHSSLPLYIVKLKWVHNIPTIYTAFTTGSIMIYYYINQWSLLCAVCGGMNLPLLLRCAAVPVSLSNRKNTAYMDATALYSDFAVTAELYTNTRRNTAQYFSLHKAVGKSTPIWTELKTWESSQWIQPNLTQFYFKWQPIYYIIYRCTLFELSHLIFEGPTTCAMVLTLNTTEERSVLFFILIKY